MLTASITVIKYRTGEIVPYFFSSSTYLQVRYFSQTSSQNLGNSNLAYFSIK